MLIKICVLTIWTFIYSSLSLGQDNRFHSVTVRVNGAVEFVIKDPLGKRSGFDPKLNQRYDEINESYGVFSIDSEDPNVEPPESVNEFMTQNPVDGKYSLSLYGTKPSEYRLSIVISRALDEGADFIFKGVMDSAATVQYEFEYSSVSGTPFTATKVVSSSTLRQDLDNSFKLNLLGGREFYKELNHRLDKFEKELTKKDSSKARHELEKFWKNIDEVFQKEKKKEKNEEKEDKKFVTDDAYQIFQEDVQALLNQLPLKEKGEKDDEDDH